MSPATEQLLETAMSLPESERLALADALLGTVEQTSDTDNAWIAELDHRFAEMESGVVAGATWEEVKLRGRALIEGRKDA